MLSYKYVQNQYPKKYNNIIQNNMHFVVQICINYVLERWAVKYIRTVNIKRWEE